jgi:hypothetical protein
MGMQMLRKALALDANYDDAMAYMNLLYRLKAAMVDNPGEAAGLLAEADKWVGQALEAKRRNPKPAAPASAKLDLNGPPPGAAGRVTWSKRRPRLLRPIDRARSPRHCRSLTPGQFKRR